MPATLDGVRPPQDADVRRLVPRWALAQHVCPAGQRRARYAAHVPKEPEDDGRERPSGRAAVMDAVLDAATELIADRGPNAVTVRAIAQRAGVNHALVHRYFGTKDDLIGAVITREVAHFWRLADAEGERAEVLGRMLRGLSERRVYIRFLARAILDGYRTGQLKPDFLLFDRILEAIGPEAMMSPEDRRRLRVAVAALGSMALGWRIFGEFLTTGMGLDGQSPEELDTAIDQFIGGILQAWPADRIAGAGGS